jgi:hypothetical protein
MNLIGINTSGAWTRQGGAMPKHAIYNEYHYVRWMTTKAGNTMTSFGKGGTSVGWNLQKNSRRISDVQVL